MLFTGSILAEVRWLPIISYHLTHLELILSVQRIPLFWQLECSLEYQLPGRAASLLQQNHPLQGRLEILNPAVFSRLNLNLRDLMQLSSRAPLRRRFISGLMMGNINFVQRII